MNSTTLNDSQRKLVLESVRHALLVVAPEWTQAAAFAQPGGMQDLEGKLDALVEIARRTRSDRVEPYLAEILDDVCTRCHDQQNSGYCPLRHAGDCVLYACAGPIMWAIGGALRQMCDPEYMAVHGDAHERQSGPPRVALPKQEVQNMNTREIDRTEWAGFFDAFSRHYRGRPVSIEVFSQEIGAQVMVRHEPLMGITAQSVPGTEDEIEIILGDAPDAQLTHVVRSPTHVHVKQPDNGEDSYVQIESASGPEVLIDLHVAQHGQA